MANLSGIKEVSDFVHKELEHQASVMINVLELAEASKNEPYLHRALTNISAAAFTMTDLLSHLGYDPTCDLYLAFTVLANAKRQHK